MNKNNIGRSIKETQMLSWKRSEDWEKATNALFDASTLKNQEQGKNYIGSNL
jgi:ribosomal protein L35AE/L33A